MADLRAAFEIGGIAVPPGSRRDVEIPVARLPTGTGISLPVSVLHGRRDGPRLWLSAAIHGDELNGVEIVRRVLRETDPRRLAGTIVGVPIVNVFGFLSESRYLPDRRDLNRSFPGSVRGSLASRLAALFMSEVVERCTHGIDLHTGSDGRANLPQVRADLDDAETARLAVAFGAPVMIDARLRDGSLREAATRRGSRVLLYEAGEAARFDRESIRFGVDGVRRVLSELGMTAGPGPRGEVQPLRATATHWIRARGSGILVLETRLGARVAVGDSLGTLSDALQRRSAEVRSTHAGLIIGITTNPLVHRGDAVANLAEC